MRPKSLDISTLAPSWSFATECGVMVLLPSLPPCNDEHVGSSFLQGVTGQIRSGLHILGLYEHRHDSPLLPSW